MPPPQFNRDGSVARFAQYNAYFQSNTVPFIGYFDIEQQGYGEEVTVNATIRPIPWSNVYAVSVQMGLQSLMPIVRTYKGIVWTEFDYGTLRASVGTVGALTTPREGGPQGAILNSLRRADMQEQVIDYQDINGALAIELQFTMLTTGNIGG